MGATAGLVVAYGLDFSPLLTVAAVLICAGSALLPDCDQPSSTFGHSLGFITRWLSKIMYRVSSTIYIGTRTSADANGISGHRKITHTIIYNLILGAPVFLLAYNLTAQGILFGFLTVLAIRGMLAEGLNVYFPLDLNGKKRSKRILKVEQGFSLVLGTFAGALLISQQAGLIPWQLTLLVVLGSLVHLVGDCCTPAGVPLFWPLPIDGKIWYKIKTPLTFDAGKKIEKNVITPILFFIFLASAFYMFY